MTFFRTLITIVAITAAILALSQLMLGGVHVSWSHSANQLGLLEPFVAAIVAAIVVVMLIVIGLFVAFVVGGVLLSVGVVLGLTALVLLLPAFAPLLLVIGGIWLIIHLFREPS